MDELRLEKVTKKFADLMAVTDFDLSVAPEEYIFILGPSGCGKSVLLRLIAGLERPSSGSIYVRDVLMNEVPSHLRNIPVVFQNFALFPHLTVRQNIEYGLRIRGAAKNKQTEKSDRILAMLKIQDMAQKKPHQLSAGQRQRVGLGRALAVEPAPRILLLDEPLGALDANLHINMQFELKSIQKELGITFIQVTHNQSDALAVGDRIVVMNRGRAEQVGKPSEIFSEPKTRFVAELLGNNNVFEGRVIGKRDGFTSVKTKHGTFHVPVKKTQPPENSEVAFVVRLDRLTVDPDSARDNHFNARFRGKVVNGSLVTYEFVSNDQTFKLETHLSSGLLSLQASDQVTLGWNDGDGYLIGEN
jgi:ABC-type Fe3+/spermidine/putrescine transport system ATPase subunit